MSDESTLPKRRHVKKAPEDLMPPEKRAELSRECGRMNDGSKTRGISNTERAAIRALRDEEANHAVERLGAARFRVRKDIDPEILDAAASIGKLGLQVMTEVLLGRHSRHKSNVMLKAAIATREEVCDPLAKEINLTGRMTLEQMVAQASALNKSKKGVK